MQFNELRTKGDFIDFCFSGYNDIYNIDAAIPLENYRIYKDTGICTTYLVTVYYKNSIAIENIVAKATILYLQQK